jgi:hypothetical protein
MSKVIEEEDLKRSQIAADYAIYCAMQQMLVHPTSEAQQRLEREYSIADAEAELVLQAQQLEQSY